MTIKFPPFSSLPLQKDGPPGNAWHLFGPNDQLGMLNLLTPATTRAAAHEITEGLRISLDLPLDKFSHPAFGRQPFRQQIIADDGGRPVNDDALVFNTQASSQWDGFRHYGYQASKQFFGGAKQEDFEHTSRNGISAWVENGGIIGRGVLLDYHSWAISQGIKAKPLITQSITLEELQQVAQSQNVTFQAGDILCVRSGYLQAFDSLSADQAKTLTSLPTPPSIGVQSCEAILKWIWENQFAAVVGDMPGFEAWPCQDTKYFFHEWLLAGWGLPIGELFDLDSLAAACRERKKWSFFFSSVPLKVPGGVASPPNAIAIL